MERGLVPQRPPTTTAPQPQLCSGWKGPSVQLWFLLLPLLIQPCSKSRISLCHAPRAKHVPAPTLGLQAWNTLKLIPPQTSATARATLSTPQGQRAQTSHSQGVLTLRTPQRCHPRES